MGLRLRTWIRSTPCSRKSKTQKRPLELSILRLGATGQKTFPSKARGCELRRPLDATMPKGGLDCAWAGMFLVVHSILLICRGHTDVVSAISGKS
jgi:hypothetical protein